MRPILRARRPQPRRAFGHNGPVTQPELAPATPWVDLDRESWSALRASTPLPLTDADVERLRGLGDPIDLAEVDAIYRPLSRLLDLYIEAAEHRRHATSTFLRGNGNRVPYVINVAESVAVGKSTTARLLHELITQWPATPRVELITTDGFLLPNAELERRGLMQRKGFPESRSEERRGGKECRAER